MRKLLTIGALVAAAALLPAVPAVAATPHAPALGPFCFTHTPPPSLVGFSVVGATAVVCTEPMQLLEATYELEWNGIIVETDIERSANGTGVGAGATSPCTPGTYAARLTLDLKWPVGTTGVPTYTETSGAFVTTC
jgi:hypothetical protein